MSIPTLPDVATLRAMGISEDIIKKLCRMDNASKVGVNPTEAIKRLLRKTDRQQFINRFQWYNLPGDIDQELVERQLYYKGQCCFFFVPELGQFKVLPFSFVRDIDEYGRYKKIKPLPFNGKAEADVNGKNVYIPGLELTPIYSIEDAFEAEDPTKCAVIIKSYSKDYSQTVLPEKELMEPVLDLMSEAIPMARTSLIANCGVKGMRVNNANDYTNVLAANASIQEAALSGEVNVPIVGQIEFQELTDKGQMQADQFLMYMQSLDNFRLSCYGLSNGGLFEKKGAYVNDQAVGNIQANVGEVYEDALRCRQDACDLINGLWGVGVMCMPSETVTNTDNNGDGVVGNQEDQNGTPGSQDNMMGVEE